jgi:hypothetical protein
MAGYCPQSARGLSRRRATAALAGGLLLPHVQASPAVPAEVAAGLPDVRLHGSGRLRYFGLHIYDARLWAGEGFVPAHWAQHRFALELQYARELRGTLIAERALQEMRGIASFDDTRAQRWLAWMQDAFPDVAAGDRLTGLHRPGEGADLFHNAAPRSRWPDAELAGAFFGIWLSPQTSQPALRRALLGDGA